MIIFLQSPTHSEPRLRPWVWCGKHKERMGQILSSSRASVPTLIKAFTSLNCFLPWQESTSRSLVMTIPRLAMCDAWSIASYIVSSFIINNIHCCEAPVTSVLDWRCLPSERERERKTTIGNSINLPNHRTCKEKAFPQGSLRMTKSYGWNAMAKDERRSFPRSWLFWRPSPNNKWNAVPNKQVSDSIVPHMIIITTSCCCVAKITCHFVIETLCFAAVCWLELEVQTPSQTRFV